MTGRGVPKLLPASELLDQKSKEPVVQLFCQLLNGFVGPCLRPGKFGVFKMKYADNFC